MEEWQKQIISQNEALISLIGRLVFPEDKLKAIVMRKKRNPQDYVKAYNLCDGKHSLGEIATAIKVTSGTLSPILAYWKSIGILYEVGEGVKKSYKSLYALEELKQIEIEDAKVLVNNEITEQQIDDSSTEASVQQNVS